MCLQESRKRDSGGKQTMKKEMPNMTLKNIAHACEGVYVGVKELEEKLNQPIEEGVKMSATVKEKTVESGALKYFK